MPDGADGKFALHGAEGRLGLGELDVGLLKQRGIITTARPVGAQQVGTVAMGAVFQEPPHRSVSLLKMGKAALDGGFIAQAAIGDHASQLDEVSPD